MSRLPARLILVLASLALSTAPPDPGFAQNLSIDIRGKAGLPLSMAVPTAACRNADLTGNWYIMFRQQATAYYCGVAISADGTLELQACTPRRHMDSGKLVLIRADLEGKLAMGRACTLSGNLVLTPRSSGPVWNIAVRGAMSIDKNTWMADGFVAIDGNTGMQVEVHAMRRGAQ